jgi:hypothetical protein
MIQAVQIVQTVEIKNLADEERFSHSTDRHELLGSSPIAGPTLEPKGLNSAFSL